MDKKMEDFTYIKACGENTYTVTQNVCFVFQVT